MDTKEPDSRLSVRKQDLEDEELYRFNQVINDLYSKITTARDETDNAIKKFTRSGVIATGGDLSSATVPGNIPPLPEPGIPQPQAGDWALNTVVYSAGEDGLQYGFASATILNKPADVDYYSMFIQDYSSGYVNTSGTSVTLTSASKEAGNTFEGCVAGQVININSVAYVLASDPTAPYETATLTASAGTQTNVYFNLNPVNGKWEEIAPDAEAGTWQLRPPTGWDVPCCITASTKEQKTFQPPDGIEYKRLVFSPWGVASQVTNFAVSVEQQTQAGVPSGRFVVNFTKPLDPEYYYASIERLFYVNSSFTGNIGATAVVDVSGDVVTYNSTSVIYTTGFQGQNFTHIQPGDTVYIGTGSTLTDSNTYIVAEVTSSTQLKLTTSPPSGTEKLFAQWGRVAGEINSFTQTDYWPLPSSVEYWKFRARSVNHREIANDTTPPTVNVTVPNSSGITAIAPGTITTAAFASTIRPVDLVTTSSISVTSIVVISNSGTVTTSSPHGLTGTRQVAIFGGTGTSSKLNGLYTATVTGLSTLTITTSGVSNGTYSAGLNEVPLPTLPSSTYPVGAVAFMTANTKLYRSNGTAWTIAADGSDIVANSITAGQIAAGAISTTELFAGEILVGQGGGKPSRFTVVDSSSNVIGFIGDFTSPAFVGGYFKNLLVSPTLSTTATPRLYATSAGLLELVGMKIQATGSSSPGAGLTAGTVTIDPSNQYGPVLLTDGLTIPLSTTYTAIGSNYVSVRNAATGNSYPFCEITRTSSASIVRSFGGPNVVIGTDSFVEIWTDATYTSSYARFRNVPIQIGTTTAIDINRNGSFVNLTGSGYVKGSSTSAYIDTDFNTAGQAAYRLRGSALIDNGGVWVSAGGVNVNAGCAATGFNIFGGGTGQTVTVNFSGGFTIGGNTYYNLVFTGGILTGYTV